MSYMLTEFEKGFALVDQARKKHKKKGNPLLEIIEKRKKMRLDTKIIIGGEAGIGKSETSLRLAELHDPRYVDDPEGAIREQLFWRASGYMKAVTSQKPFSQLIGDEPAQAIYHRQFMSMANIILNKTMVGNRFKRFITVLNLPFLKLLDSDTRAMAQYFVWIDGRGHAEVYRIVPQKFGGDPWYKTIINNLWLGRPSERLRTIYKKVKGEVQNELYNEWLKDVQREETPIRTRGDMIDEVKADLPKFMKGEYLNTALIAGQLGCGRNTAEAIKAKVEADLGL